MTNRLLTGLEIQEVLKDCQLLDLFSIFKKKFNRTFLHCANVHSCRPPFARGFCFYVGSSLWSFVRLQYLVHSFLTTIPDCFFNMGQNDTADCCRLGLWLLKLLLAHFLRAVTTSQQIATSICENK